MRFIILAIVLAFPLADLYLTARIARWSGIPLWVWLGGSFVAGALLLNSERNEFRMKTVAALHGQQPGLRGLLDSGRRVLAGFLLMLPGIASDVVALLLLALPLNVGRSFEPSFEPSFGPSAAGSGRWPRRDRRDALDGDYRRID